MAVLQIPVKPGVNAYEFPLELERIVYLFKFHWNTRAARWVMGIATRDGQDLASGIPMLTGVDLLGRFQNDALPPGDFMVYDTTGAMNSPDFSDFGKTIQLLYFEAGTLEL